jgi:cytosine/adenosine deaminase-related metal-dependent hydrolase
MRGECIVRARWLVVDPSCVIADGGLWIRDGRVERVLRTARVPRGLAASARRLDFGDAIVAPGLVNAHAHLELSGLAGVLPRGRDFAGWIRALLAARATQIPADWEAAARCGADRALATGTTTIGDIDTSGAALAGLRGHALRVVHLREALDAQDPSRTSFALRRVSRRLPRRARRHEGLSPHAPFTVSPALLNGLAKLALRRDACVQMHWSETREEVEWMRSGGGPLAPLLGPSPRRSGLELLADAGLLTRRLSLVHANHLLRGEAERLARARATVVHCPGSHAWFERAPFPWRRYRAAGVRVALGTDSWASNDDLDLRRELRLASRAHSWLPPEELWAAATTAGARALGLESLVGALRPGLCADWIVVRSAAATARRAMESLCGAEAPVEQTWIEAEKAAEARPEPPSARAHGRRSR